LPRNCPLAIFLLRFWGLWFHQRSRALF
jgi:hypothetical protein